MPKLSIITINYNNVSGLQKTIKSVVSQTSRDFEYIVIDGGSTDGSLEVIKDYAANIIYWVSEPDSGIYQAMNKGIRVATGEYCQFLNSGDWLAAPDVTEKMLKIVPDCSIVYGNMIKQLPKNKILLNKQIDLESFLTFYQGSLNHSPAYIKRNLFEKYGYFDEGLKIVSDWKFFLQVVGLNNEKVVYRNINITCFDMMGISNTNNLLDRFERQQVLKELLPSKILTDYERYSKYILQMKRICRFKITKYVVFIIERILFLIEKIETKLKREHVLY